MMTSKAKALTFICCVALLNLAIAQDQSGFISIDCGLQPENSSYTETSTDIKYVSDSSYTDTGTSYFVAPENRQNMKQSMWSVRSFPEGIRNCYTIAVNSSTKYLIRADFMYGNYDSRNEIPGFDLHLGPNKWDTVELVSPLQTVSKEIIYYVLTDTIQVCLVNTGNGTPFISVLELRQLPNSSYAAQSESLQLFQRLDFGSTTNLTVRYPNDVFDRIWFPATPNGTKPLSDPSTSLTSNSTGNFRLPQVVMRTGIVPDNPRGFVDFGWIPDDPSLEFFFYLYFTELQQPNSGTVETREFVILLNGKSFGEPLSLNYFRTLALFTSNPLKAESFQFSLRQTQSSSLPPLINAMETYFVNKLPQSSTDPNDLSAMRNIKSAYKVKRNWEGDMCVPQAYTWEGLNCSFNGTNMPRVIALNLSSAGLTGEITSDISRLSQLQILDLSNNNLSGPAVPAFLAQLQFLRVLHLANNQLSGPIPSSLIERLDSFSISGNPSICSANACEEVSQNRSKKNKLPSFVIPLVASLAGLLLLFIISAAIFLILMRKKKQGRTINRTVTATSNGPSLQRRDTGSMRPSMQRRETGFSTRPSLQRIESGMTDYGGNETAVDAFDLEPSNRKFTYAEIVNITNGFDRDQGKVGFGRNYLGKLDGKEVTVKLVSSLSSQGYKQLRAERTVQLFLAGKIGSVSRPGMSQVVTALKESLAVEVERKKHLPVGSTDSLEELALGFGSNPPPRLR
ncbi:unnamed protein product [Arabidopsis thaliana]|uniref:(thale cress) hypothetical protein n=1 Tax=Arabidopsis thaliana TaxID=3702 RepID=A0A7G2E0H3_ARATH|nr:unnamed protein product [Arabidopsis thaliana]